MAVEYVFFFQLVAVFLHFYLVSNSPNNNGGDTREAVILCFILKQTATETREKRIKSMRSSVFRWFKKFKEGSLELQQVESQK